MWIGIVHYYPDARALMHELKAIGAHNVNAGRSRGLTGKSRFARMQAAYEQQRVTRGLPATWQVVHAVAWVPDAAASGMSGVIDGEVRIGVDALQASLSRRRR